MLDNTSFSKLLFIAFLLALIGLAPVSAQTNSASAPTISCPAPTAAAPVWGKLVLNGNTVTCYYATGTATPTTWKQIGVPQTLGFLNNPLLIGIYVSSHNSGALSTGTIDNFSITPAPTYRLQDQDIGAPSLMGCANLFGGVWTISGSGADIWNSADQFNFQPWLVWGNCTVICRVTSISTGDMWQKIGIMVRDGYNSGSDYAMFCASDAAGVDFQYRLNFDNNGDAVKYVAPPAPGIVSSVAIGTGLTGAFQGPYPIRP